MLNTGKLAGKTLYISGASRGIGLEMAKKAARDGANVVVAAKTADPHPKLPGTIFTAAKEIEGLGGNALPLVVDVRSEGAIQESVEAAVKHFGGIDIVINNASAISLTGTQETPMKTYDLMHSINTRGTYLVSKCCLPYLKESASKGRNPHILNNSPPLSMKPIWFKNHVAYTMAKYGMSMCVLGMAEEFRDTGIAVNAIWPKTAIMTAAMEMLGGGEGIGAQCRTPQIMADAAYVILTRDSRNFSGNFCVDEAILRDVGVTDFSPYLAPGATEDSLMPDFFLDEFLDHSGAGAAEAESIVARAEKPAIKKAAEAVAAAGSGDPIEAVFGQISAILNEDLVKKTNAVFSFTLSDQKTDWYLDMKNGAGSCGKGKSPVESDATLTMTSANFNKMFAGKLKPTAAFMSGRLKISGNMGKAMKLEKLMGKMSTRGYHTSSLAMLSTQGVAQLLPSRSYSDTAIYTDVKPVFDRIKTVASPAIVKKIKAVFVFDIEGEGRWHVDLKNGKGDVGFADPSIKADVTVTLNKETFLKIFNRELKAATAFMNGQMKLSGDLSKAMALESMMKATRNA
eukprot:GFUD01001882.1.p1 GENE.GFUD01001882.1~~GFUD01001882.1.p1  ORF type:complete len:569 (-),score=147.19 GFUD01001882.1:147-1853(-)